MTIFVSNIQMDHSKKLENFVKKVESTYEKCDYFKQSKCVLSLKYPDDFTKDQVIAVRKRYPENRVYSIPSEFKCYYDLVDKFPSELIIEATKPSLWDKIKYKIEEYI